LTIVVNAMIMTKINF